MKNFRIMRNFAMPIKGKRPHFLRMAERDANDGVRSIKVGFCWMIFFSLLFVGLIAGVFSAFMFFFWAISHRLWLIAFTGLIATYSIYFLLILAVTSVVPDSINDVIGVYELGFVIGYGVRFILAPLLAIIIGFMANKWRVKAMEKKGYGEMNIIKASSKKESVELYLVASEKHEQREEIIMEKGEIKTTKKGVQIVCTDGSVVADLGWEKFPVLYGKFLNGEIEPTDKYTLDIEKMGEQLGEKNRGFIPFFEHVKEWGGKTRCFIEMQTKNTSDEEIAEAIRCAMEFLRNGDIKNAIEKITEPKGIGMSYGSKTLRMLSPQHVGVYDLVLQKYLLYNADADGYVDFCSDCGKVADKLNNNVKKPKECIGETENGDEWRVADVEAVLFFYYYKLKKGEKK